MSPHCSRRLKLPQIGFEAKKCPDGHTSSWREKIWLDIFSFPERKCLWPGISTVGQTGSCPFSQISLASVVERSLRTTQQHIKTVSQQPFPRDSLWESLFPRQAPFLESMPFHSDPPSGITPASEQCHVTLLRGRTMLHRRFCQQKNKSELRRSYPFF